MEFAKIIKTIAHRSSCAWSRAAFALQEEEPVPKFATVSPISYR